MSESEMNTDRNDIEAALGALAPARASLDRDRLMYDAGFAAANRRARRFQWWGAASTAALLCVSAGLAYVAASPPEVRVVEQIMPHNPPERDVLITDAPETKKAIAENDPLPASDIDEPISPLSYLRLRRMVLTHGIESLPEMSVGRGTGPPQPVLKSGSRELPQAMFGT